MVAILNAAGTAVVTYTYDAWGNPLSQSGSLSATLGTHNPLRYRGYVYDQDTGLYYLQSRYYDPQIGRFINADGLTSTGQGVVGKNMFAYCLNSPVNKIDLSGAKAYDLFDSPDEAALDFAICYNAQSIEDKQEYGSSIFMYSYIEKRTVVNTFSFRLLGINFKFNYYITYNVLVTKYYYNKPAVGRSGHTVIPNFVGLGTIVSTVHTHANYDPKYDNENFSNDGLFSDIGWANLFRMNSYMVTPGGYLKKYTYKNRKDANGGITIIPGDIPWDPNCPYR